MLFKTSIKYPITFNLVSGKTDLDDSIVSINRCIALILTSAKNELLGDPDYGSRLYEMLFDQYSDNLETRIKKEIVDCLTKFESRAYVTENDVTIEHVEDSDRNRYKITISYSIIGTNKKSDTSFYVEEDAFKNG